MRGHPCHSPPHRPPPTAAVLRHMALALPPVECYKFHNYILCDLLFVPRCHVCLPRDNAHSLRLVSPLILPVHPLPPSLTCLPPFALRFLPHCRHVLGQFNCRTSRSMRALLMCPSDWGTLDLCLANLIAPLSR